MNRFFVILLALLLMACQPAPLTVMSFNVRNSAASDGPNDLELRKSATAAMLLSEVKPDVFGVQEARGYSLTLRSSHSRPMKTSMATT
ncbi:MAG: hypothetical protein MJY55_01875 [Bacteroidales bacterium]|nr:hypothetical protein [Bacteroidales bacterium]